MRLLSSTTGITTALHLYIQVLILLSAPHPSSGYASWFVERSSSCWVFIRDASEVIMNSYVVPFEQSKYPEAKIDIATIGAEGYLGDGAAFVDGEEKDGKLKRIIYIDDSFFTQNTNTDEKKEWSQTYTLKLNYDSYPNDLKDLQYIMDAKVTPELDDDELSKLDGSETRMRAEFVSTSNGGAIGCRNYRVSGRGRDDGVELKIDIPSSVFQLNDALLSEHSVDIVAGYACGHEPVTLTQSLTFVLKRSGSVSGSVSGGGEDKDKSENEIASGVERGIQKAVADIIAKEASEEEEDKPKAVDVASDTNADVKADAKEHANFEDKIEPIIKSIVQEDRDKKPEMKKDVKPEVKSEVKPQTTASKSQIQFEKEAADASASLVDKKDSRIKKDSSDIKINVRKHMRNKKSVFDNKPEKEEDRIIDERNIVEERNIDEYEKLHPHPDHHKQKQKQQQKHKTNTNTKTKKKHPHPQEEDVMASARQFKKEYEKEDFGKANFTTNSFLTGAVVFIIVGGTLINASLALSKSKGHKREHAL